MTDWKMFTGEREPHEGIERLARRPPPPWRPYRTLEVERERRIPDVDELSPATLQRGRTFQAENEVIDVVNAALYLRRPILVTGKAGSGKSSLIDAVAYELRLGEPLRWSVTSRSTLRDALYRYDAIGRLQEQRLLEAEAAKTANAPARTRAGPKADSPISAYLRLGPLGTALLPTKRPRALLVDEIDKADLDLPNDLLNILEDGEFEIPELARLPDEIVEVPLHEGAAHETYPVRRGKVRSREFPFVVFTSNGERDFSAAFLRRCLRLEMPNPCESVERLERIVAAHLGELGSTRQGAAVRKQIEDFVARAADEPLATDQLLNAVFLVTGKQKLPADRRDELLGMVTRPLV